MISTQLTHTSVEEKATSCPVSLIYEKPHRLLNNAADHNVAKIGDVGALRILPHSVTAGGTRKAAVWKF